MRRVMGLRGLMGPIGPRGPRGLMGPMRLMGLMGLVGLMGCSSGSSDELEPTPSPTPPTTVGVPISFCGNEGQEEAVTRADTPLNETGVENFKVWGYKNMSYNDGTQAYGEKQLVFPGYRVDYAGSAATTTTNTNGWDYILTTETEQTVKYWDWNAKAYRFFAVTETGVAGENRAYGASGAYWTSGEYGAYAVTIAVDAESNSNHYFSRLWFSTGNLAAYPDKQFGKPVTLEFVKPLARVRFQFIYVYPREGLTVTASFKPTAVTESIALSGTVTVYYPTDGPETKEWFTTTAQNTREAFTEDYDPENDTKEYNETEEGWYTVLPNNAQGSYTLTANVNGEEKPAVVPEAYMQWLPGYSYTYIFKINEEGGVEFGQVVYAVTPWIETAVDRSVYNW